MKSNDKTSYCEMHIISGSVLYSNIICCILLQDFHDAAEDGDLEEVKRLIRLIDDVDIVDKRGDTALILAASEGRVEVMR